MKVIKRCGDIQEFNKDKIVQAIAKAGKATGADMLELIETAMDISDNIEAYYSDFINTTTPTVEKIEEIVFYALIDEEYEHVAKAYESFRAIREFQRQNNSIDDSVLGLLNFTNEDVMKENSNKNPILNPTQRDLIAGEVSKDFYRRKVLPPHLVQAHDDKILHIHDMDYMMQKMFNCCLINIKDIFDNGTVINEVLVETPKGFQVACTVLTQVIAQVASSQLGGQSVNIKHLGKYLKISYDKYLKAFNWMSNEDDKETAAYQMMCKELQSGIQTIQYQVNTLMTTNGQSPFLTVFLELDDNDPYLEYTAMIIEEMFEQRIRGVKNEKGVYIMPTFPKLVYVIDEKNSLEGGKYDYLTELAAKCVSKRMYPDFISRKMMEENYEGNCFSPMGCRSFLSPWKDENGDYKFEGRFNQGVVSLNLVQVALSTNTLNDFWTLLDERLELCYEALMVRHKFLLGTKSDVSPIHWQHGAIARLKKGEVIDKLLKDGYSTLSLGYIGLYETVKLISGVSHTENVDLALEIMNHLKFKTEEWKKRNNLGFALYGTPFESGSYKLAKKDKERFGSIKDITDKEWYTNSYHVDVREDINAFDKLKFESQFQSISTGGCISYIEVGNITHNLKAIEEVINYMYHNIQYAEFNIKSDCCQICNYQGEITLKDDLNWQCPQCENEDTDKMSIIRRSCGYAGSNLWNYGKTSEIYHRKLHL